MVRPGAAVGLLGPLVAILLVQRCSGSIKCALYVMDQPGKALGKLYSGKEIMKPKIDCDSPNMDMIKRVCSGWFTKVNTKWGLKATSRSRGDPFTIGDDLCRLLKTGTFTFGAFFTYCDNDEVMYTGQTREDATLCCKDSATC